jgi:hypothetical protein
LKCARHFDRRTAMCVSCLWCDAPALWARIGWGAASAHSERTRPSTLLTARVGHGRRVSRLRKELSCVLGSTPTGQPTAFAGVCALLSSCCALVDLCRLCANLEFTGCLFANPLHVGRHAITLHLCATSVAVMRQRDRVRPRVAGLKT